MDHSSIGRMGNDFLQHAPEHHHPWGKVMKTEENKFERVNGIRGFPDVSVVSLIKERTSSVVIAEDERDIKEIVPDNLRSPTFND